MRYRTEPSIVIYRLRRDAFRLNQWALKHGSQRQQEKARKLIDAISYMADIFPVSHAVPPADNTTA